MTPQRGMPGTGAGSAIRWVLGGALLVLVVWLGVRHAQTPGEPSPADERDVVLVQEEPVASGRFALWVTDSASVYDASDRAGEYARAGLEQLADAVEELVDHTAEPQIAHAAQALRQRARRLGDTEVASMEHAKFAADACVIAAGLMEEIGASQEVDGDFAQHAGAAVKAAAEVRPDAPVADQRAELQQFFNHIAAALDAVDRERFRHHRPGPALTDDHVQRES